MNWTIPGTVLQGQREDTQNIEQQFRAMFLGGDLVLSQVSAITGLETYHIQNWVKRGFLTAPEKKRYSLRQLCRIININVVFNNHPDHKSNNKAYKSCKKRGQFNAKNPFFHI